MSVVMRGVHVHRASCAQYAADAPPQAIKHGNHDHESCNRKKGTMLGHESYGLCRVAGWPSSSPWSAMAEPAKQRNELCNHSGQL